MNFGKNVFIGANTVIYCTNEDSQHKNGSEIIIGEGTYIGEMNNIRAAGGSIKIGKKCLISQHVSIIGSNHSTDKGQYIMDQPWDITRLGVTIHDDVWIGCGAKILPGVTIGTGAVIAAGAVVVKDIEAYTFNGGIPAKFIKMRV
ncbi:acyltransferase [Mucilaginibacter flavus]|uniref:acyltransferase n=1 Tax=Mucilaginibacter flavus TaxID=931504 RepID=UPI0025B38A7A|nr:acyltransferase [Mucilaginibacter flavus]MDN3582818.1 acyltransferase [Mucilaginibacter flavus]